MMSQFISDVEADVDTNFDFQTPLCRQVFLELNFYHPPISLLPISSIK